MPTIKNYSRSDRLDDFPDAMSNFYDGGSIDGLEFNSIRDAGVIEKLWSSEIQELVDMDQISGSALKWKPLSAQEKQDLLEKVDHLMGVTKTENPQPSSQPPSLQP